MKIHLVGIGGFGLSAIAEVLLGQGVAVSGSDQMLNERTLALSNRGASIFQGHDPEYVTQTDLVLVSSAIPPNNPELLAAAAAGIPVMKRAQFLSVLLEDYQIIAVAGTHGKTTTTGMIVQIMMFAGLDPSVIVGGVLPLLGSNGRAGKSQYFVIEADEYDYMFWGLYPDMAVVTNVEYDHPDLFPTAVIYQEAFGKFIGQIRSDGQLVYCADDPGADILATNSLPDKVKSQSYGLKSGVWRAADLRLNQQGGYDFLVLHGNSVVGLARLRIPGEHNVYNALAAIVIANELSIPFDIYRQALAEFDGIGRRFQIMGEVGDVVVIDDYAHHPTEIRATLAAARKRYPGRRLWAVWQPHTFSRTKKLLADFATCFTDADRVIVLEIYRSRETDDLGIDTAAVLETIQHPQADYVAQIETAAQFILDRILPGDVILTLTAGDGNRVGELVLKELDQRVNGRALNTGRQTASTSEVRPNKFI